MILLLFSESPKPCFYMTNLTFKIKEMLEERVYKFNTIQQDENGRPSSATRVQRCNSEEYQCYL